MKVAHWVFGMVIWLVLNVAQAASVEALSTQYSDDTLDAVKSIAVRDDFAPSTRARQVVARLSAALGEKPWTLVVYQEAKMPRDMGYYAFALPGRRIALSDWAAAKDSENALAFTIGHEMVVA